MRRDMDTVRSIMLAVEEADRPVRAQEVVPEGCTFAETVYHIELMAAHGLLDARVTRAKGSVVAEVQGLTWDGYDFLDAMRDDRVWERAKRAIRESVGSTTMGVVKAACVKVAEAMVMSHIGA